MRKVLALTLMAILAISVIGFAAGTKDHPYRLILVPSTDVEAVARIGDEIAAALTRITGLEIEAFMTPDIPAAISEYSTAEADVFGFLSTAAYLDAFVETLAVTGEQLDLTLISVRNGYIGYWTGYYVNRDSGYTSLYDLEGKTWGYPYPGSTSGFRMPNAQLAYLGITPGPGLETGSHDASMIALYNGDVDFITGFWSPPQAPIVLRQMGFQWNPGDPLELGIWNDSPVVEWGEALGRITGDLAWYVKDLRQAFLQDGSMPDIIEKIMVLALSDVIPNDGVSFVPGFPEDHKALITQAIIDFVPTPEGKATFGDPNFYEWDDVQSTTDAVYDPFRRARGYEVPER